MRFIRLALGGGFSLTFEPSSGSSLISGAMVAVAYQGLDGWGTKRERERERKRERVCEKENSCYLRFFFSSLPLSLERERERER